MLSTKKVLLAVAAAVFSASSAFATTYTWVGTTSTDWHDQTNWNPNNAGFPSSSADIAIIPDVSTGFNRYPVLSDANYTINRLEVQSPASTSLMLTLSDKSLTINGQDDLEVQQGARVLITGASGKLVVATATSTGCLIDGKIELHDSGSELNIANDVDFVYTSAPGVIQGDDPSAAINIASGKMFRFYDIAMTGSFTVTGSTTSMLGNYGEIVSTGTVTLASTLPYDDDAGVTDVVRWHVAANGASIAFNRSANLVGRYLIDNGLSGAGLGFSFAGGNVLTAGHYEYNGTTVTNDCTHITTSSVTFTYKNAGSFNGTCP